MTPSYLAWRRWSSLAVYGRAGVPIVVTPDVTWGLEAGLGATWFFLGGFGVAAEMVGDVFYGAGHAREGDGRPIRCSAASSASSSRTRCCRERRARVSRRRASRCSAVLPAWRRRSATRAAAGATATELDRDRYANARKLQDCERCQECGLDTARCQRACDPTALPEIALPATCRPLHHDGEVCLRALAAASCETYATYVDDEAPATPSECEFCRVPPPAPAPAFGDAARRGREGGSP